MEETSEIDDELYSRQRYVLGDKAMLQMKEASIFLYGLGSVGIEIAKNLTLAGIKLLAIADDRPCTLADLGTQFFIRDSDIKAKKSRAEASCSRLAELNPYATVKIAPVLSDSCDLNVLKNYQCVILTEVPLKVQVKIDDFCRNQNPPIKFISSDVLGVFSTVFCDFGDKFEVYDPNGEECKEIFIANITKNNPGVVTCLENKMHGFESGDVITFKEVTGMSVLNESLHRVTVLSPFAFSIGDTSGPEFFPYEGGGIATQVKIPVTVKFDSLEKQLLNPKIVWADAIKDYISVHLAFWAVQEFKDQHQKFPQPWYNHDAELVVASAKKLNQQLINKSDTLSEEVLKLMSYTSAGCLPSLSAVVGGIAAQEGLKAVTGKFSPLQQWLYIDACEIIQASSLHDSFKANFLKESGSDRYDSLRICLGSEILKRLSSVKLFMIGCGAIGCELLKNFALLGISTSPSSLVTITDNDLIEKSNLNRQFLFRPHHIQQSKSVVAAKATQEINPDIQIEAQQYKVGPLTEDTVYTDEFFERQDCIVNALDNVEARRYVDSRCVSTRRALMESGTLGTKGHIQVIVPHLTESYSSQNDPVDEAIPYCTLKSFPAQIEHTIQWARDKFESLFTQKPLSFNKFWLSTGNPQQVINKLQSDILLPGISQMLKVAEHTPLTWVDCVTIARFKFDKYFNHKAKRLLNAFPLDTKLKDGTLFWQSPKRPPTPLSFDSNNQMHLTFIFSTALILARIHHITPEDLSTTHTILQSIFVPEYQHKNKKIETDESAKKADPESDVCDSQLAANSLQNLLKQGKLNENVQQLIPQEFEKDNDSNGHIDFITSASNLRAFMYNIDAADRLKVKRIAGHIMPAIATTTAAVAGLACIELIKVLTNCSLSQYKNCFLNLALPMVVFSEPAPAIQTIVKPGLTFTLWDRWDINGNGDFTLQQFLNVILKTYELKVVMVVYGVKMIYVPVMPGHNKRLSQTMICLIKPGPNKTYVDLTLAFESLTGEEVSGPPVRYTFK